MVNADVMSYHETMRANCILMSRIDVCLNKLITECLILVFCDSFSCFIRNKMYPLTFIIYLSPRLIFITPIV